MTTKLEMMEVELQQRALFIVNDDKASLGNDATYGAGIFVVSKSKGTIKNCRFLSNTVNATGGGISVAKHSKTSVEQSHFAGSDSTLSI